MEEKLANDCHISLHRNQIDPELHLKSTLTFAHSDRKFDKQAFQMSGDDNLLRTKILTEINEDFHAADVVNYANNNSEILMEIVNCFEEQDEVIRELSSRAIIKVCGTEQGREIIVSEEIIPKIRALFDDPVVEIRANSYKAMISLAEFTFGIDSVISFNIVSVLIDKLSGQETDDQILILILQLFLILLEGEQAAIVVQGSKVLKHLNAHLASDHPKIREMSAMNLGSISFNNIGKDQTIEANSISPLCEMLTDQISEVRCAATRALASLATYKEGKTQIFDLDKLNEIIKLLYDKNPQTRLNIVQLICNVGEYPPAKEKFKECIPRLQEMVTHESNSQPLVAKYALQAIETITWAS